MKYNLITLAIIAASSPALAVDFGLANANTDGVNTSQWQCKRCSPATANHGQLELGAGYADIDDAHAQNALGSDDSGAVASMSGQARVANDSGWRLKATAHDLGLEHGDFDARLSKDDRYRLTVNYRQLAQVDSDQAVSQYHYGNDQLTPAAQAYPTTLGIKREQIGVGLSANPPLAGLPVTTYLDYRTEDKTGHQRSSVVTPSPVNLAKRVDSTTDTFAAGAQLQGQQWLAALDYQGSVYRNHLDEIYHQTFGSLLAMDPDNESHQITLSGNLLSSLGQFDGRISSGRLIQDDQLVNAAQSPIQNWDGQIDTLDASGRYTTVVGDALKLQASGKYSDRDNQSSVFEFAQYDYNAVTGLVSENVLLDHRSSDAKLAAQYRVAKGYRFDAEYRYDRDERSHSDREVTEQHGIGAGFKVTALDHWRIEFDAGFSQRDGSRYQANSVTSTEQNELMRKYYLADRNRLETRLTLRHQPTSALSMDLSLQYASDDYTDTEIGLTDAKDYGYQLNASYLVQRHLSVYGFAGQQWIDANQSGSQAGGLADWTAQIEDRFVTLGAGFEWSGLMQDSLTLGGDYLFANSDSDASNSGAASTGFDDYYSYSHSVGLFARYLLSPRSHLKLDYRYERYYDTDYADVAVDAVNGLTTLGDLNHNYNAHQLMLTYSISL
ncbi:decaheme-associated outer membrane protein, MtrB/PioB family [Ferrimonas sediminum]|uniref:Decaheme-associated outer membrane protein, MtrB/PioB family n=1 Tax=Ferrimonas sediminum TaxID=718193 RepID=A0A1G8S934_9GAMM|nr:MtrB/PioB family decaheme-associated outer membrane protein [Ferrimonas sediminum]SDJ25742.1 decaheme-associated outer membrane protein, MtrB/PioB family [Ferrimonas sediminum]